MQLTFIIRKEIAANVVENNSNNKISVLMISGSSIKKELRLDCGRRSKGKGKGIRVREHTRGRREGWNACKEAIVFAIPPTN